MRLALALSALASLICYHTAGNSLNLFIGCFLFATILTAQLQPCASTVLGVSLAMSLTWFMPLHARLITLQQWILCLLVLITFLFAIVQANKLLMSLPPAMAASLTTITSLAWLTWPIWMSPHLPGSTLHYSILFHPLFAINHQLINLGIWTEQQAAYNLTTLGQDAQYQLPFSVWPAILLQVGVGLIFYLINRWHPVPRHLVES